MDIRVIETALRDYKRKRSVIETTLLRVEQFKEAIEDPDAFTSIFIRNYIEPGMPRGKGGIGGGSSVEKSVQDKEEAIELLRQWINDDKSRIYPYQIEKEQIDAALGALTRQQVYIIECKYFEDMFWRDIEVSFNEKFRQKNYITYEQLKKLNKDALDLLTNILEPYYSRFKIS